MKLSLLGQVNEQSNGKKGEIEMEQPLQMSKFEKLSQERKYLQDSGGLPEWFTTHGWQVFKEKFLSDGYRNYKDTVERITTTLSKHTDNPEYWNKRFFEVIWKGWLALSTPVLANTGLERGLPVSCSGSYIDDSIDGFYTAAHEAAMLTKNGFGTSSYLGDIRPRGSKISSGGDATGSMPVFRMLVQIMRDVVQGSNQRRGAWAGYIEIDHDDFWEICEHVKHESDDANVGFIYTRDFIERLQSGDKDALERFQGHMKLRAVTGKGYFFFREKANDLAPSPIKDNNKLVIKSSNLCTEIFQPQDEDHTYTCVLSSLNLVKYDEWKDTDLIKVATVFLDCVVEEFIERGKHIPGLEKAVRYTEKSRAIGLGALGFHTYLQQNSVPFESLEANFINNEIFAKIQRETEEASRELAEKYGEPEWCKGYNTRNLVKVAVAPNTTSALICGGVSQGIEPVIANVYLQTGSSGELHRINPVLIDLLKSKGKYTDEVIQDIAFNEGSVQHLDFLSDHEKLVFKTAYEIDQRFLVRWANSRQKYIDQGQSLNLFFGADEDEQYIADVHEEAIMSSRIKSLYYMHNKAGVSGSKGECISCEG